jgi:hypothetical protein
LFPVWRADSIHGVVPCSEYLDRVNLEVVVSLNLARPTGSMAVAAVNEASDVEQRLIL